MTERCIICGWTLAKDQAFGCVPGRCSYRPDDPAEQDRLRKRRDLVKRATKAVEDSWSAHGEVPFPLYSTEAREIAAAVIRVVETPNQ
jgi:hypothetical protein